MDAQTQVIKFYSGKTTTGKQKWDVYFANGSKATAWEYAVAAKAEQALQSGEFITAQIEEKPNPNGGNPYRNLQGVTLGAVGATPAQAGQIPQNPVASPQKPLGGSGGGMSPEDKIRVTKLSCISSAAAIFSGSGDVEQTLEAAKTIFSSVWDIAPAEAPVVAATPQAVADFVTANVGEEVGAPIQVGTPNVAALPWATV